MMTSIQLQTESGVNLLFPEKKISVANLLPALIIVCLWR